MARRSTSQNKDGLYTKKQYEKRQNGSSSEGLYSKEDYIRRKYSGQFQYTDPAERRRKAESELAAWRQRKQAQEQLKNEMDDYHFRASEGPGIERDFRRNFGLQPRQRMDAEQLQLLLDDPVDIHFFWMASNISSARRLDMTPSKRSGNWTVWI